MSNCTYLWGDLPLSHDQAFGWSSSHYCKGNIVSIHKPLSKAEKNMRTKVKGKVYVQLLDKEQNKIM